MVKRKHTTKTSVIASLGLVGIATAAGLGGQQVQAHADNTTGGVCHSSQRSRKSNS